MGTMVGSSGKPVAHPGLEFVAGDDWKISATLLDETGAPYDLTAATVKWALLGTGSSLHHILGDGDYTLSIVDAAAGTCSIVVLAAKTTTIAGGQYKDALRIISDGVTSTLSMGAVYVTADPWVTTYPVTLKVVA